MSNVLVLAAVYGFPILFLIWIVTIMLGRKQIMNTLKYMIMKNRGYSYFAFFRPDGRVTEEVLKRDKRIQHAKKTYFWRPEISYRYFSGGNFFVETNCNPVSIKNLMLKAENPQLAADPVVVDALMDRVYNWGKNSMGQMGDKEKIVMGTIVIGFIILGLLVYKNTETLSVLTAAINNLAGKVG